MHAVTYIYLGCLRLIKYHIQIHFKIIFRLSLNYKIIQQVLLIVFNEPILIGFKIYCINIEYFSLTRSFFLIGNLMFKPSNGPFKV